MVEGLQSSVASFKSQPPLDFPLTLQKIKDREEAVRNFTSTLSERLSLISDGLTDINRCPDDAFNMQADNYICATAERRRLWLEASRLEQSVQS